ncbi:hypothetical protein [Streptomyces sp. NPDC008150]|uniref:hypothetical protein n=1 Tax=Streptomyces sp. NPDC008150 TaxID=3364816 RepID=UPI0036F18B0D
MTTSVHGYGPALARLPAVPLAALGALVLGAAAGVLVDPSSAVNSPWYPTGCGLLLAIGLYGSTYGIDTAALRGDVRGVAAVVTVGVVLKAALISAVMVAAFGRPEYLVLGVAVAQIDPLSVAALGRADRVSERARSLLAAWAAFDDPMTVLLTLYLAGWAYHAAGHRDVPSVASGGTAGYLVGLGWNAALLAVVALLWWAGRRLLRARHVPPGTGPLATSLGGLLIVATLLVAAVRMLMPAVAGAGLVVRAAALARPVARAVTCAFLAASLLLGLFLARGVALLPGLLLGATAFAAQAVVALLVLPLFVRGLDRRDRTALGLGQQNGITAVLLALTLERDFPGTVRIVGPAVLTVNVLHLASRYVSGRVARPARPRVPGGPSQPAARPPRPPHRTPRPPAATATGAGAGAGERPVAD